MFNACLLSTATTENKAVELTRKFINAHVDRVKTFPEFTIAILNDLEKSFYRKGFNFDKVRDEVESIRVKAKGAL